MPPFSFLDSVLGNYFLYPTIFLLLLLNGFFSFPSSQILYLFLGYFFADQKEVLFFIALWGAAGNSLGNLFLHSVSKKKGVPFIKKIYKNADHEIEKILPLIKKRGYVYVFFGKLIPAVKVFIPLATSLLPFKEFYLFCIFFVSSFLWALGFLFIGVFLGASSFFPKIYSLFTVTLVVIIFILKKKDIQKIFHKINPHAVEDSYGENKNDTK